MSECYLSLLSSDYDVVVLSETWLYEGVFSSEFVPDSYAVLRCDRDFDAAGRSRGGGVLIAIKNKFISEQVSIPHSCRLASPTLDMLACRVQLGSISVVFVAIYLPNTPSEHELNVVLGFLEETCLSYNHVIVCGDFNIPTFVKMSVSDKLYATLDASLSFAGLKQCNYIKNSDERILDLIMATMPCTVSRASDPLVREDPRHPPLSLSINHDIGRNYNFQVNSERPRYNFKKANYIALYNELQIFDWGPVLSVEDADEACSSFYDHLYSVLDRYVPKYRSKRGSRRFPHWFSRELIDMIQLKERYYGRYASSGDEYFLTMFKDARAKVKALIRNERNAHLSHINERFKTDPQEFWRYVSDRRGRSRIPGKLYHGNELCDTPDSVVGAFGTFFSSVFTPDDTLSQFAIPLHTGEVILNDFEEADLLTAARKLKNKLTAGLDQIPDFFVKDCIRVLIVPLLHIFNCSLRLSTFPSCWKSARICPVYKSGDPTRVENYRPISVLSSFSKLFEIVMHERITSFLKGKISVYQHGFVPGRSTVTNLCCFSQYCSDTIDAGGQVDAIYLDLSKAFDKINHALLLNKLMTYGLPAKLLLLMHSYLSDRRQFVEYNGFRSPEFVPTSGVPQGSNLGPLLFSLFVNDLPDHILMSQKLLFADDIKIYYRIERPSDCVALQNDLNSVNNWCNENCLLLNSNKCKVMTVTRKRNIILFDYSIDRVVLERASSVADLGVVFDHELRFSDHIFDISTRANKILGFVLRSVGGFADQEVLISLFNALVRSRLDYGSVVWDPLYNIHIIVLESVQRRFLKYLYYRKHRVYPPRGYDHKLLLDEFNTLPLSIHREIANLKFLYKLVHQLIDCKALYNKLQFYAPRPASRSHHRFYNVAARTNVMVNSPIFRMCTQYNKVSDAVDIYSRSLRLFVTSLDAVFRS